MVVNRLTGGRAFARVLDGFHDAIAGERAASRRSAQRGERRRLEEVQDRFVARDECGSDVADARSFGRDRTRTPAREVDSVAGVGQVRLDEEIGHAPTVAASARRRNVETPGLCSGARELAGQLGSRADVEFAIDLRQRRLDRAVGNHENRRDFLVRLALGDELGDPLLARREPVRRSGAAADTRKFRTRALGPELRAERLENCECVL